MLGFLYIFFMEVVFQNSTFVLFVVKETLNNIIHVVSVRGKI